MINMKAMKTKSRQLKQSRQGRQSRKAKLMIALAVITGVYFVVWTLIGLIS